MPDIKTFLKGFGFVEGRRQGPYVISKIVGREKTLEAYQKYSYEITLTLTSSDSLRNVHHAVMENIDRKIIIHSRWGNPYECYIEFGKIRKNGSTYIVELIGHATRVSDEYSENYVEPYHGNSIISSHRGHTYLPQPK